MSWDALTIRINRVSRPYMTHLMTHYLHVETNDKNTQLTIEIVHNNHDNYTSDQLDRCSDYSKQTTFSLIHKHIDALGIQHLYLQSVGL